MYSMANVEIFAAGTHNGDEYTERDLDEMVAAFNALDFKPPLKAGHVKDEPGMPALGWVSNLRRVGQKLIADFTNMPELVYNAVRERQYNTVSSEIFWNLKRGGNVFRRALKAVALLGADIPAVANLRPLHEMFSGFEAESTHRAEFALSPDIGGKPNPDDRNKGPNEMDLAKLQEQVRELSEKQVAADARAAAAEERAKAAEAAAKAADDERKAYAKRVDEIAESQRAAEIKATSERCVVPALRPLFAAYARLADKAGDVKVYSADGKEAKPGDVLEDALKVVNESAKKMFSVVSSGDVKDKPADVPEADIGKEVDKQTKAYMTANKERSYSVAMKAVLDADPDLKAKYAAAAGA